MVLSGKSSLSHLAAGMEPTCVHCPWRNGWEAFWAQGQKPTTGLLQSIVQADTR